MANRPILILQMQRMGDLILSFPLLLWLQREYPGHPLWVMGEPQFYDQLLAVSPRATYFPWTAAKRLESERFALCVNLSHASQAAVLAGRIQADAQYGAVEVPGRGRYVHGQWQLYRTALVQANRHNRFHWADLNALDCISLRRMRETRWPLPRIGLGDRRRIGLFLGASEEAKRPAAAFWAALARELLQRDLRPILLGGPGDRPLANEVRRQVGLQVLNLAGRMSLAQLAHFGQGLELMVTPDTGPMHLAAWTGLRTLNLSMGPVNAWETGPYQPGHYVLQARMSCAGCWQCTRDMHHCRQRFLPRRIAQIVFALVREHGGTAALPRDKGLNLFVSQRSTQGLHHLRLMHEPDTLTAGELLGRFWQLFWGGVFGLWPRTNAEQAWNLLDRAYPVLTESFVRSLTGFQRKLGQATIDSGFWAKGPVLLRPLFSHVHLLLQNTDYSKAGHRQSLAVVRDLLLIAAKAKSDRQL